MCFGQEVRYVDIFAFQDLFAYLKWHWRGIWDMSAGSWLVASIAKLGAFIMVISGVSSDINEWLLAWYK